jgi:hypothetical protein
MWHKSREAPRLAYWSSRKLLWFSSKSFILHGQVTCVWSINAIRYFHWYHTAKYTRRGNANTLSSQIFDKTPSHLNNGYRITFTGVKRPGHGIDHSLHPPPMLKKEYSYFPFGSLWHIKGWIYFTLFEYVRLPKNYSLALRKNVRFGETSAKLDTYKNAAKIDGSFAFELLKNLWYR